MPDICLYFQVHQPPRLRPFNVFDPGTHYFDTERNRHILQRVAHKCYLPATDLLLQLIDHHNGRFRLAFSLTGSVIEQFEMWEPALIERFRALVQTGCVELLGETYHHSLASTRDADEFEQQVAMHRAMCRELFDCEPKVFRNTELVFDNALAQRVDAIGGFQGILAEGVDELLDSRSPNKLYRPAITGIADGAHGHHETLKLLLKNYRLSDDIAFRFCDQSWSQWPLTAEKFADNVQASGGDCCNLFMDFETFGEHQWPETGIFEFLTKLPEMLLARGCRFLTPSQATETFDAEDVYAVPEPTSWADCERDLSAWLGNAMQHSAMDELYRLGPTIKRTGNARLIDDWRRLTTSDHFYYMCTKYFADGAVHKYFSPYESPYDSYINFVNVLEHLKERSEEMDRVHSA